MFSLSGYELKETIHQGALTTVLRGTHTLDNDKPIVVKFFNNEHPELKDLAHIEKEFEITQKLQGEGIIEVISLEKHQHSLALVLEDFGGVSLAQALTDELVTLSEFLNTAIAVVKAIGRIHKSHIIHKDINPSNILWNRKNNEVKLIDFGISTALSKEIAEVKNVEVLEGTLAYISPEQTGRMNRSIDYRSDFYSLGVTLYELASGGKPFVTDDAMEMIHCHIAKEPDPVHRRNQALPLVISKIIGKLMAKNAEDRYQSSAALLIDLERCQKDLIENEKISDFAIGQSDFSSELQIPQKLYGRDTEIEKLLTAFDNSIQHSSQLLLISGSSGIGKSALVNEIHKSIVAKRGNFIFGKFDQLNRDMPYAALIQAFQDLVRQILTAPESELEDWKARVLSSVGDNGQVLIEVVPELVHLLGKQPALSELPADQSKNRLLSVVLGFVTAISNEQNPLVLFIDDLQWADSATLELLGDILKVPRINSLLVIGAYRDNEVLSDHPLHGLVDSVKNQGKQVHDLRIQPLSLVDVNQLVADTLRCSINGCHALSELVYQKTQGNPFFVNQFLLMLHQNKLLSFDFTKGAWKWKIDEINSLSVTDNVVALLTQKIKVLPEKTQNALKRAAVIGNRFNLKLLSALYLESIEFTLQAIAPAVDAGMILPASNDYLHLIDPESRFSFQHDKVQQACYELIDIEQRDKIHLHLGRVLKEQSGKDNLNENIFSIVNHFNFGAKLIEKREEKIDCANLNLIAGKKAKNSSAYPQSLNYFKQGIKFLNKESWKQHYQITLNLYINAAEVAFISGQYKLQEDFAEVVISHVTSPLDRSRIDEVKIASYMAQYRVSEVIEQTLLWLDKQGISFKKNPSKFHVLIEILKCQRILSRFTIEELESLPPMTNQASRNCLAILLKAGALFLTVVPNLSTVVILKRVLLTIEKGNAPESAPSYAAYALIQCAVLKRMKIGNQFGELALKLSESADAKRYRSRTHMVVYACVYHWTHSVRDTIEPLRKAYYIGIETGDWDSATIAIGFMFTHSIYCGMNLELSVKDITNYDTSLKEMNQLHASYGIKMFKQLADKLMKPNDAPTQLTGDFYDEVVDMQDHHQKNDAGMEVHFYSCKVFLCFVLGDYEQGESYVNRISHGQQFVKSFYVGPFGLFYSILTLLMLAIKSDRKIGKKLVKRSLKLRKLIKTYMPFAPNNYAHKWELILALTAQFNNKPLEAEKHFSKAISMARENEFLQEEAIATQLAAEFYQLTGFQQLADLLIKEAYYLFERWGAKTKCMQMQNQFSSNLKTASFSKKLPLITTVNTTLTSGTVHHTGSTSSANISLDLASVMKASQAISGEIVLPRLIDKIMSVVLESAGAQTGFLIKSSEQGMLVYSQINQSNGTDNPTATEEERLATERRRFERIDIDSIPLEDFEYAAHSVINYVTRSKEMLIIKNATLDTRFGKDPYIKANQIKSLLCYPLINQGELTGILYLENNLAEGAFTDQRIELLDMISSQLAVSIDNADLYTRLERLVTELRTVNDNLEHIVDEKTRDIKSILEAIKQGILEIENDEGSVGPEYSKFLEFLTGTKNIRGQCFYDLLFENSTFTQDDQSQIMGVISASIGEQEFGFTMNSHLLPREAVIYKDIEKDDEQSIYELDWNPIIKDDVVTKILLVVRDVTELRALELTSKKQRQEFEIIQEIINLPAGKFHPVLKSCNRFVKENRSIINHQLCNALSQKQQLELIQRLFINMHTMKGLTRSYHLRSLSEAAHIAEQSYQEDIKSKSWDTELMLRGLDETQQCIDNYKQVSREKLGRALANANDFIVDRADVEKNFELLSNFDLSELSADGKIRVLSAKCFFSDLICDPLEQVLSEQIKITASLARQLDKVEPVFVFDDPGFNIKQEVYELLNDVFARLIRNSIDHGIEQPPERTSAGKSEQGKITITLEEKETQLEIRFSDDGRGLNLPAIYQLALKKGIIKESESVNPEYISNLIFTRGFSTEKQGSDISGRGIGMDMIKDLLKNEGCSIKTSLIEPSKQELSFSPVEFIITLPAKFFTIHG